MGIVQNKLTDPSGAPIAGKSLTISLISGTTGGFVGSTSEILSEQWATTDATGFWSATLTPNSTINPANTYYTVRQLRETLTFVVPAGAGPFWVKDLLVQAPTMPAGVVVPLPTTDASLLTSGVLALGRIPALPYDAAGLAAAETTRAQGVEATHTTNIATNTTAIAAEATTARAAEGVNATNIAKTVPRWSGPGTVYTLGQQVVSPGNDVVSANVAHTSSAAYATDLAKWSLSSTYVPKASDASRNTKSSGTATLAALTTGTDSTASGYNALTVNTSGTGSTAFGANALAANTTGVTNEAFGWNALAANTTGACLVAVGANALAANTTADDNIGIGSNALTVNTTGASNTAVGTWALWSNTTAAANVAVGFNALKMNTTGASNTAIGTQALAASTTGASNVAVGASALAANTTGITNEALGSNALAANTTGSSNVAVGESAGFAPANVAANKTITGSRNTFIGYQSGAADASDPWQTVALGWWATVSGQYAVAIGAGVSAKGSGTVAIGCDSAGTSATATAANSFVLGTALHRYKMPGLPTVNPGAGSGILWSNAGVVTVA